MERVLQVHWWGKLPYDQAVEEQEVLRDRVIAEGEGAHLIFVEHPSVVTCGRNYEVTDEEKLAIKKRGFDFQESSRGGKLTYHGPGQLVMYPIVHLGWLNVGVKGIVRAVIDSMGNWLTTQGIETSWRDDAPGLWTAGESPRKIASVGMRITRQVTWHGAALNLSTDLSSFTVFQPCGFSGSVMTSVQHELGRNPHFEKAARGVTDALASILELKVDIPSSPTH